MAWLSGYAGIAYFVGVALAGPPRRMLPADAPPPPPQPAVLLNPGDDALFAARDMAGIQGEKRYIRYLTAYNFSESERAEVWRVLSVHINGLSREPELTPLVPLPGSRNSLVRLNLRDYGIEEETWDKLGAFDPYFRVKVQSVKLERSIVDDGNTVWVRPAGTKKGGWVLERGEDAGVKKNGLTEEDRKKLGLTDPVSAVAPWLSDGGTTPADNAARAKLLASLYEGTQSTAPILRADWFFRHTAIQEADKFGGKAPGYYDFLRLKEQKDFEGAVGADLKVARTTFKEETFGVVTRSRVAKNNRRLMRFGKFGKGAVYFTLDSDDNTGKKNYLRNLDTNIKAKTFLEAIAEEDEFSATEAFGNGPNGLMIWWLASNKKVRQNAAPSNIASDYTAPGADHDVHINMSCVRCHVDGVQPIKDVVRTLVSPPLAAKTPDYEAERRFRQLYTSDFDEKIAADQEVYKRAVFRASGGMTTEKFSRAYAALWARYQEQDFDIDRIVLETGYSRAHVLGALDRLAKATGAIDPVAAGLLRGLVKGDAELPIRSEQFEELFPVIMAYMRGYSPQ